MSFKWFDTVIFLVLGFFLNLRMTVLKVYASFQSVAARGFNHILIDKPTLGGLKLSAKVRDLRSVEKCVSSYC